MKQAAAAYAIAVVVIGLIVTAVMARETPEEKKAKEEAAAAAPRAYPSGMTRPEEIASRVQEIRGERFDGPAPKVEILAQEEVDKRLQQADTTAEQERAKEPGASALSKGAETVLTQTGALSPDEVGQAAIQYAGPGVLGKHLPAERTIVVSEELVRSDRRMAEQVVAHEMARALENEGSTPRRALPFRDDESASLALEAGAAALVEARYATEHLGVDPPVEPTVADRRADESEGETAATLQAYADFPSEVGGPVVAALHKRGGWKAVENAKLAEPLSTRDVLHPGSSENADDVPPPQPAIGRAIGKGWKRTADGTVGELDVLALLASGGEERPAVQAAEGWEAGAFETWGKGSAAQSCKAPCRKQTASLIVLRWRTPKDTEEYGRAVRRVLETTAGAKRDGGRAWRIEDGGAALVRAGRFSALAFAPDAPLAGKIATAALAP